MTHVRPVGGLLPKREIDLLRAALSEYTVEGVHERFGPVGQAALERGDLVGAARQLPRDHDSVSTLITLFVLGDDVDTTTARRAFDPLPLEAAQACGLVSVDGDRTRALIDVRPHTEQQPDPLSVGGRQSGESSGADWWVVSDFGSDVRPGTLAADHVLGVGGASVTLAQTVPRGPVRSALDVGTGSGVQALHLARHADSVTATDISRRALTMAATTAELSGLSFDLREGSLLEPVVGERFDLVVANPPFVVSPGTESVSGWEYRDGGAAGDAISERLVRGLPSVLSDRGSAHLLANWLIPRSGDWRDRVGGWLEDNRCDSWVWQREVAEPGEYVGLWLRDSGVPIGSAEWRRRYEAWLDWFSSIDAVAVGMGMVSMWRSPSGGPSPTAVLEDVPQPLQQPVGAELSAWVARARWLATTSDDALAAATLRAAPGLVLDRRELVETQGWETAARALRQSGGMRWEVDVDESIAGLVAACDGHRPLSAPLTMLALTHDATLTTVVEAVAPVVRDLVQRGFLLPDGPLPGEPS